MRSLKMLRDESGLELRVASARMTEKRFPISPRKSEDPLRMRTIALDRSGNLWFGGQKGAFRYDGKTMETFTTQEGLLDDFVGSMIVDRAGNIWLGHPGGFPDFLGGGADPLRRQVVHAVHRREWPQQHHRLWPVGRQGWQHLVRERRRERLPLRRPNLHRFLRPGAAWEVTQISSTGAWVTLFSLRQNPR